MTGPADPIEAAQRHLQTGRPDLAVKVLEAALARTPRDARVNRNLGLVLMRVNDHARGLYHAQRAAELQPANAENWLALAEAQMQAGRHAKAAASYERAIAADPRRPEGYAGVAQAKLFLDDADAAAAAYERSLAAVPGEVELWRGYASLLMRLCRHEEAAAVLRRGIAANPDRPEIDDLLCNVLNYVSGALPASPGSTPVTIPGVRPSDEAGSPGPYLPATTTFEAHARFGRVVASHIRQVPIQWTNSRDPDRALKVGYLSPDLRGHSCAHFIEPILRSHRRDRVDAVCYFTGGRTDEVSDRLRKLAAWRDVSAVPFRELAEVLRRDGVDILVELSGHTADHRLLALARRAAPVQMTYLGYPNTTGLAAIDYRVVDAITDPPADHADDPGGADARATEKLIRLPGCFLCYQPPYPLKGEPLPAPVAQRDPARPFTFASFNMVQKINAPLVAVWSRVLKETPGSRLMLKCDTRLRAVRERVLSWFNAEGIGEDRLLLPAMTRGFADHLALYNEVDLAIDTFPYNGTTTTCEALWMGVPVITLEGEVHASRVGASLLTAAGLPELITRSADEFIGAAAALAGDADRLHRIRGGLRDRLLASPLCDGPQFTAGLEDAYRCAWRAWCANPI